MGRPVCEHNREWYQLRSLGGTGYGGCREGGTALYLAPGASTDRAPSGRKHLAQATLAIGQVYGLRLDHRLASRASAWSIAVVST